ncbi:MAG TPA: hypothetical protein VJM11_11110 [Nevskiaceae bacterium]|nr:hypothetical protein [Nevskiaceae bacterium]
MARYLFVAHTNPVEGHEDEFNAWYSNAHLDDMRRLPGVVSARRFERASVQVQESPASFRYLALYEVETDDPQTFVKELLARAGTPALFTSPSLAPGTSAVLWQAMEPSCPT